MVEMMSAKAFETELNSITQTLSLSDFINQHVRKYFNNCYLYCIFSDNAIEYMHVHYFDSEFSYHFNIYPDNPIKISDHNSDDDHITIRVHDDGSYEIE